MTSPTDAGSAAPPLLRGGVSRPLLETVLLWYGILGAPVVWLVRISVASALVPYACASGRTWTIHATTVLALALSAAAGVIAWRGWRRWEHGRADGERPGTRSHLLAVMGVLLSVMFTLAVVMEGLAPFYMDPCQ
ncbi:MAG TPA: hypothetical protein VM388_12715 [Acidimicrobiales bacterium]|nr:hypothetical protein [Acidimicrobiales bacterium]